MNKRFVVCALSFAAALWAIPTSSAQSPFDGTWRTILSQSKLSPKPVVSYLSEGWYHCVSCSPAYTVKADGTDQPVTGQTFDTISVKDVDPQTLTTILKKGGSVVSEATRTVSKDGKTLTVKITSHPAAGGAPVDTTVTATRVGIAPKGVHATSGSWRTVKVAQSDNALLQTFKTGPDGLTMSYPTGETFTAKLDGTDAPVKGAYTYDTVSLTSPNKNTIDETDKRAGTTVHDVKMTVSPDGKKMTIVETINATGRTSTYYAVKQ